MKLLITLIASLILLTACFFDEPVEIKTENVVKTDTLFVDTSAKPTKCEEFYFDGENMTSAYNFEKVCVLTKPILSKYIYYNEARIHGCPKGMDLPTKADLMYIQGLIEEDSNSIASIVFKNNTLPSGQLVEQNIYGLFNGKVVQIDVKTTPYYYYCVVSLL